MITSYGKLYAKLYNGSMFGKSALHFAVMGYVIGNGVPVSREVGCPVVVDLNPAALASLFSESEERVEAVIADFCAPDLKSDRKEEEGRRLVRESQFRYRVVNGRHYRDLADKERRAEQQRKGSARYRARMKCRQAGINDAGEREYVAAFENGATEEELEKIIEKWAKIGRKEQAKE